MSSAPSPISRLPRSHCEGDALAFFFHDTATTDIYTLSLHDALPISHPEAHYFAVGKIARDQVEDYARRKGIPVERSEEHTSELQSHVNLVCRLLLEKKKYPTGAEESVRRMRLRRLTSVTSVRVCPAV